MNRTIGAALLLAGALGAADADGTRWWSYVKALANDDMRGRETGSPEHRKAAEWVAAQFERAGLKPAGSQGYIQPVKFEARKINEAESSLELVRGGQTERLTLGEDATIGMRVPAADILEAPLVFAGYGLVVPEKQYDDLAGLDLRGKIMVTVAGGPVDIPGPLKAHYGSADERGVFLEKAGVVGTVTIVNPHAADIPWSRSSLARLQESMSLADPVLTNAHGLKLTVTVNAEHADKWLAGTGHTIDELLSLADAGKPLPHFAINASLRARVKVVQRELESQNVAGVMPGSDPALRREYVVISAHLDHVGVGQPINGDSIYNGAMDNASGVASLIDMAQTMHDTKARPRRSVMFLAVTAEEKGLLGSHYFAAHPTVDRKTIVADINMDMFLPLFPFQRVTVYGLNESDLGDVIRQVAAKQGVVVQDDPEPQRNVFVRSDQYSFIRAGVPSLSMKVGFVPGSKEHQMQKDWLTNRYHAPSDDLNQPVDLKCAADYNRLLLSLAEAVANNPARPQWKQDSFFRRFAE